MKRTHAAILAVLIPMGLAAQQPTAPPANPITTAFRGRIMANHRNLAQAFDSIPASLFGYKPTPAQLADALGLTESLDPQTIYDLAVVGAGPGGICGKSSDEGRAGGS